MSASQLMRSPFRALIVHGQFSRVASTAPCKIEYGGVVQSESRLYNSQTLSLRQFRVAPSSAGSSPSATNIDTRSSLIDQAISGSKQGIGVASESRQNVSNPDKVETKTENCPPITTLSDSTRSVSENSKSKANAMTDLNVSGTTEIPAKIPEVPSTSLGLFEEADEKDPNKWKKFAWKYGGAVLLFMISYKTLHWYVDRLEADGKRRREEMEENKKVAHEIREKGSNFPNLSSNVSVGSSDTGKDIPSAAVSDASSKNLSTPSTVQMQTQTPQEFFDQLSTQALSNSSELDELYILKRELEQKRKDLSIGQASDNCSGEISDIDTELEALNEEIKYFEGKKQGRS